MLDRMVGSILDANSSGEMLLSPAGTAPLLDHFASAART
jgi:hypothetical protein